MDNPRVKMRIHYPDGNKLKLALVLQPGAALHLNQTEIGLETGCLLEIRNGAVRIRSEKGEVFQFRGVTGSDFTVRVGDTWTRGNTKIEFLTLPDIPVEDDSTRYVSFSQMRGARQPEPKQGAKPVGTAEPAVELDQGNQKSEALQAERPEREDLTGQILRMQVPEPARSGELSKVPPEVVRKQLLQETFISLGFVFVATEVLYSLASIGREQRIVPIGVAGISCSVATWIFYEAAALLRKFPKFEFLAPVTLRNTAFVFIGLSAASAATLSYVARQFGVDLGRKTPVTEPARPVAATVEPSQLPDSVDKNIAAIQNEVAVVRAKLGEQPVAAATPAAAPVPAPVPASAAAPAVAPVQVPVSAASVIPGAFPEQANESTPTLEQASLSKDAFFSAVKSGDLSLIRSLVDKRIVDVNYTLDQGTPALHIACMRGYIPVIKYLLSKRANINARDASGATALHWAVYKRQKTIALGLVRHGADLNAKTESGDRPIDLARRYGLRSYFEFLTPKAPPKPKPKPIKTEKSRKKHSKNPF